MALTLEEFLPKARQLNPDYTDDEHIQAYEQRYGRSKPIQTVSAAPLTTFEAFLPKARALNPDYSDDEHYAAWQEKYGARGAKEKDLGFSGTLLEGAKSTGRSIKAAAQTATGNLSGVEETARVEAEKDPALQKLLAEIQIRKNALGKDPSWWQSAKAVGGAVADHPKGAAMLATEQLPNSALALGSAGAGALAGSALGPAGTIIGGIAGLFIGNTAIETGAKAIEKAVDGFTPDERTETLKEGAIKGGVVTGFDAATFGLTKWLTGTVARAMERATINVLAREGVEVTDKAAVQAARQNPDLVAKIQQAQDTARAATNTLGKKLARGAGEVGSEAIGEGAGEYIGEVAATGKGDKVEAVIEALSGLGQSGAEIAIAQGMSRRQRQQGSFGDITGQPIVTERQPEDIGVQQPAVLPGRAPFQIEGPIQPGEVRGGTVYAPGEVLDVSPLPDVSPITKASSLDEAIASAVGVVQGATETAKSRADEFARMTAKAKNETDALLANAPEKRPAVIPQILPGPESQPATLLNQPSPIVPGQAFTPRSEIDDPRARLAEERARMVTEREQRRLAGQMNPVSEPVVPAQPVQPASDGPLPSQADLAYPSSKQVRDLIHEKGLHLDTPVFREILKQTVKKEKFSDLTPQELQTLADAVQKIKAPQQPTQAQEAPPQVPLTPAKKPEKPYAPVTTIPEAQVPRSELTSEKNAEVLLRAEKAKADMEIAGTERGGRFFQEQPGTGSTQEVTGMKSATADWYRELTSGPSPAIRGDRKQSAREKIEVAIAKIIKDQGADRGKAVEQVKAALLKDQEFHRTEWGRDLASILEGEWPSYMQKPAQPLSNTKELQATENTQEFQNVSRETPHVSLEEPKAVKVPLSRTERLKQQKQKMEGKKQGSESLIDKALRSVGIDPNAPPDKAKAKETGPEQMSIDVPPPTSGERPIIGREATLEEAPLFSKNAQTPDAEQTTLSEHVENTQDHPMITKQDSGSSAPSPTDILASALRQAADQIQGKPASTGAINTLDSYASFNRRLRDGEVALDEYKQAFQQVKGNKEALVGELKNLTKDQLVKRSRSLRSSKNDSKGELVRQSYDGMLSAFATGRGVSYVLSGKGGYEQALAKMVESTTEADLKTYAEDIAKASDEYKKRLEGFENPQTLQNFDDRVRVKGEASLTPEQLARYDELLAQAGREKRKQAQEQKATVQGVDAGTDLQMVESTHTKTGEKLWVVKLANRVDRSVYDRLNQAAHRLGGRYSSYNKDGAIPGFTFRSEEAAKSFMAAGKGETVSAAPVKEAATIHVQNNAVAKLREMANNLQEKADDSLNADRKTNTARRARQASYAENDALASKALAETMRNLADAIESGEATHLSGLRTKAQVEMLDRMLESAKYERIKKDTKGSYVDYERQKHRKAEPEDAAFAKLPDFNTTDDQLTHVVKDLADVKGTERIRMKVSKLIERAKGSNFVPVDRELVEAALEKYPQFRRGVTPPWHWPETLAKLKRLESMGITSLPELRAALREFVEYRGKRGTIDKAKQLERTLIGNKGIGNDFFPTPKATAQRMVAEAGIEPGMSVLEPSAGNGNIADAIRAAGVNPDVVEQSPKLREILDAKGFNLVGHDFMDVQDGHYDRIVMNPPFSNGQDAEHIQHAYTLLKPGGHLIAIAGEGIFFRNDAKATAFREWLDEHGGTSEKLPEGTFQDSSLMATTGANARMVVMEKPAEEDSAPDLPTPSIRQMGIPSATEPVIFSYRGNEQVKLHTDYADAKSGDVTAAVRLVQKLVNPETLEAVAERFRGAVFVAPMAQEASGRNAIPQALAAHYASAASGSLDTQIVQVNQPRHTGADPMQRIITRAQFDGPVRAGQRHVLVDDNLTLGGTLADLSDYIQRNGGDVAGIVVLTNANRSDTLHARPKQIRTIEERFGDVLRAQLAIDPQALTGPEAGYLIGLRDADALSNRAAKANRDREQRLSAKSLSRPEDSALAESEPSSPENDSVQQETEQSPSSFLNDERGSIPASWFTRDKTATGAIDPPVARERLNASKASLRPYLLGALGLEQLSQVYGKDHAEVRQYNKATQDMEADFTEMSRDSDKVARAWTDLNIPVADKMAKVMEDARFLNFDPDPKKNQEADSVKKQELVKRFDQLPDDAKAVYRMARDFYTNMAEQRFQALKERIERAGGTPENTRKLVDRLQLAYEKVRSKVYFPFTRFGENIVVAKQMKDGKEVDREVHAFESVAEAQKFATMMKLKGWTVKQTVAREYSVDKEGPASKIVRQMHDIIKELGQGQQGLPGVMDLENQLLDSLNQSFLQALPDMSYAKHFIHAKDVKGASRDALRSFAHSALHGAHHISRIRHADKVTQALMGLDEKINETTEGDTTEARQVYNELVKRHNDIMNPNTHPVSAWLGQLGFTMSLGGVVATGITNATQVPLVTYPWLGARYGFGKASAALARAYKDFLNPRTLNKDSLFDASKSKLISESERKMLMELARRGRIDLTQTMDLAGLSSQDNLSRKAKLTGTLNEKVTRMLGFTFHAPEVMNRQVTALSTFRLEKEKGGSFEDALQRAEQAIIDTHFIYESWNRPRYMSGNFLRVLTMFRQYSQNIAYTYGRAAAIWLDRNGATKEERTVAKRQLISMLALQFGAAGALGMPFFGSAADILMAVVGAFGDDDDKRAWEVALRKWLDGTATSLAEAFIDDKEKAGEVGKKLAEVVSHGGSRLTPWDMAGRLGQNDLFFREPQREREGRQAVMDWMLALGGPVPSYGVNFLLGMGDVAKGVTELNAGFFMRGVEELTPAVLRNGVKSLRYTLEGVRTRDEYKQLDLDTSEKLGQIFGFTPARVAEMYESTTAVKNKEHRILNEQKSLKNRFARAVDDQDDAAKQRILEDIRGFNERNPIFAITSNTLNRSLKARRQREAGMERGMYLPPRRRALLDEGDFGDF